MIFIEIRKAIMLPDDFLELIRPGENTTGVKTRMFEEFIKCSSDGIFRFNTPQGSNINTNVVKEAIEYIGFYHSDNFSYDTIYKMPIALPWVYINNNSYNYNEMGSDEINVNQDQDDMIFN